MPEPTTPSPNPAGGLSPKELAREKLRARAARINRMRKRVVAASLAIFALAFGAIAFNGSMGTTTSKQTAASASATAGTADDSSSTDSSGSEDDSGSSENQTDSSENQTQSSENQTDSSDDTTTSDDSSSSSSSNSSGSAVTTRQS
jgi:hypothetical protein